MSDLVQSGPDNDTLEATEWVRKGTMLVRRDALSYNDPESWPSLYKQKFDEEMPKSKYVELGIVPPVFFCPNCSHRLVHL